MTACEEALTFALGDGSVKCWTLHSRRNIRMGESVPLPVIPGLDTNTPEGQEFQKRVVLMRYALTAIETVGNKERVWGAGFCTGKPGCLYASQPRVCQWQLDQYVWWYCTDAQYYGELLYRQRSIAG